MLNSISLENGIYEHFSPLSGTAKSTGLQSEYDLFHRTSVLLKKLEKELLKRRTDLQKALFITSENPLWRPYHELWVVLAEIRHIRKNLRELDASGVKQIFRWPCSGLQPRLFLREKGPVLFIAPSRESHLCIALCSGSRKYRHH